MLPKDPELLVRAIGRRIGELRVERGWTQAEFAQRCGRSVDRIRAIEGGRNLTIWSLAQLASTLGVSIDAIFVAPKTVRTNPGRPARAPKARRRAARPRGGDG